MSFTVLNKNVDAKFFGVQGGSYSACPEGVCVDDGVTKKGYND